MKSVYDLILYSIFVLLLLPVMVFAQWEYVGGPEKAHTRQVYLHKGHFFALDESGLYRLPVKGQTWKHIGLNLTSDPLVQIAGVLTNRQAVFVEFSDPWGRNRMYYRSTDLGETWTSLDKLMNLSVYKMDQIVVFGDTIFARLRTKNLPLQRALYYSHNGGKDWKKAQTNAFLAQEPWITPVQIDNRILVRDTNHGLIFESKDGGANWSSFIPEGIALNYSFAGFAGLGKQLFTESGSPGLLFQSNDYGRTWLPIEVPMVESASGIVAQNGYLLSGFTSNSYDFATWISADTGKTWIRSALFPTLVDQKISISINSPTISFSTDHGKNWDEPKLFLPSTANYHPIELGQSPYRSIVQSKDTIALAITGGIAYSLNNGKNWTITEQGLLPNRSVASGKLLSVGSTLLSYRHGIFKSIDKGVNWEESTYQGLPGKPVLSTYLFGYKIYQADQKLFTSNGQIVYVSPDLGNHWDSIYSVSADAIINDVVPVGRRVFVSQYTLAGSFNVYYSDDLTGKQWHEMVLPEGVFFGEITGDSEAFFLYDYFQTWQSNDLGKTWTALPVGFSAVTSSGSNLIGSNSSPAGLFISSDRGKSWKNAIDSLGLFGRSIEATAVLGDKIFIAMSGFWEDAIHFSPNAGQDWYDITANLPDFYVLNQGDYDIQAPDDFRSLLIKDGYLYASTYQGLFRISLTMLNTIPQSPPEIRHALRENPVINETARVPSMKFPHKVLQRKAELVQRLGLQQAVRWAQAGQN